MTIHLYRMQRIAIMASMLAVLALGCGSLCAQPELRPRHLEWIPRPWEMRYFIYVDKHRLWKYSQALAEKSTNERDKDPATRNQFWWEQYFEPRALVKIPHWDLRKIPSSLNIPRIWL